MSDSDEQQYAPRRNRKQRPISNEDIESEEPRQVPARASRMGGARRGRRSVLMPPANSLLPERGMTYAVFVSILAGVLDVILSVVITLSNTATYQRVVTEGKNVTISTANVVGGLLCLSLFINVLIFGITGYIVGRAAVKRRLGFVAGAIVGAIAYLASFLVRYIPNYPGNTATSSATNLATIGITLLFLLVASLSGGLISSIGAWLATRKHPYYTA